MDDTFLYIASIQEYSRITVKHDPAFYESVRIKDVVVRHEILPDFWIALTNKLISSKITDFHFTSDGGFICMGKFYLHFEKYGPNFIIRISFREHFSVMIKLKICLEKDAGYCIYTNNKMYLERNPVISSLIFSTGVSHTQAEIEELLLNEILRNS